MKSKQAARLYRVTVTIQGIEIHTTALYDTGNCLMGGKGRQPVSLMDSGLLRHSCGQIPLSKLNLGIVLYHSVGGDGGMFTIQADRMIVAGKRRKKTINSPCVGIYRGRLSQAGAYRMILHPEHLWK